MKTLVRVPLLLQFFMVISFQRYYAQSLQMVGRVRFRSRQSLAADMTGIVTKPFDPLYSTTSKETNIREDNHRRELISNTIVAFSTTFLTSSTIFPIISIADDNDNSLSVLLEQIKMARSQLNPVPDLIEKEEWDSIRALLIKPPLSDCWSKNAKPLLRDYADAVGNELPNGDELAVLEARDELSTHLRFLDMAVYNNVFNPITVEGKSGATKELVKSYYEDPIREYKASAATLDSKTWDASKDCGDFT